MFSRLKRCVRFVLCVCIADSDIGCVNVWFPEVSTFCDEVPCCLPDTREPARE